MKKEEMFQLLGEMDEKYVEGAGREVSKTTGRKINGMAWGAIAACVILAVMAVPVFRRMHPDTSKLHKLHSYVTLEGAANVIVTEGGFSLDGAMGAGSGEVVSGAREPSIDVPVQEEAAEAYQTLSDYFEGEYGAGVYPDWYGGAYIVNGDYLIVNVVHEYDETADKAFYIQIQEWAGSTKVGFGGTKYSLNTLNALQKEIEALPELKAVSSWSCGVNVITGQVQLAVAAVDDALLSALAELDPADDMILVEAGKTEITIEKPAIDEVGTWDGNPAGYE